MMVRMEEERIGKGIKEREVVEGACGVGSSSYKESKKNQEHAGEFFIIALVLLSFVGGRVHHGQVASPVN
jgi:hypothetical protein